MTPPNPVAKPAIHWSTHAGGEEEVPKKLDEEPKEDEGGQTAAAAARSTLLALDIDQMDASFDAAFSLIKVVDPTFVLACRTALEDWDLEQYDQFKNSVYPSFTQAVQDQDVYVVQQVLSFFFGID